MKLSRPVIIRVRCIAERSVVVHRGRAVRGVSNEAENQQLAVGVAGGQRARDDRIFVPAGAAIGCHRRDVVRRSTPVDGVGRAFHCRQLVQPIRRRSAGKRCCSRSPRHPAGGHCSGSEIATIAPAVGSAKVAGVYLERAVAEPNNSCTAPGVLELPTTRSSLPSPFMSPTATESGDLPAVSTTKVLLARKGAVAVAEQNRNRVRSRIRGDDVERAVIIEIPERDGGGVRGLWCKQRRAERCHRRCRAAPPPSSNRRPWRRCRAICRRCSDRRWRGAGM